MDVKLRYLGVVPLYNLDSALVVPGVCLTEQIRGPPQHTPAGKVIAQLETAEFDVSRGFRIALKVVEAKVPASLSSISIRSLSDS